MPKFDCVVGNPPFKGGLHLSFLELAYNISKQYILWISPSSQFLDEKGIKRKYESVNNIIEKHINNITFFNGNSLFNVGAFLPFAITYIDKSIINNNIQIIDKINKKTIMVSSLNEVNKWGDPIFTKFKCNIQQLCNKDNILNHLNKHVRDYFVNIAIIRGNVNFKDIDKMLDNNFYTFYPNNTKVERTIRTGRSGNIKFYVSFYKENDANNFFKYLKTNFARACLSIYKVNVHLDRGELKVVPWLDFSQEWTDEKLYKYFELTQEEINFIEKNIPKYY